MGRYEQADRVFTRMCRLNGTALPEDYNVRDVDKVENLHQNNIIESYICKLFFLHFN